MLTFLFVAVLIIPTIWLGLFIKWYREDTQLKRRTKLKTFKFTDQPRRSIPFPDYPSIFRIGPKSNVLTTSHSDKAIGKAR